MDDFNPFEPIFGNRDPRDGGRWHTPEEAGEFFSSVFGYHEDNGLLPLRDGYGPRVLVFYRVARAVCSLFGVIRPNTRLATPEVEAFWNAPEEFARQTVYLPVEGYRREIYRDFVDNGLCLAPPGNAVQLLGRPNAIIKRQRAWCDVLSRIAGLYQIDPHADPNVRIMFEPKYVERPWVVPSFQHCAEFEEALVEHLLEFSQTRSKQRALDYAKNKFGFNHIEASHIIKMTSNLEAQITLTDPDELRPAVVKQLMGFIEEMGELGKPGQALKAIDLMAKITGLYRDRPSNVVEDFEDVIMRVSKAPHVLDVPAPKALDFNPHQAPLPGDADGQGRLEGSRLVGDD